MHAKSIIHKFAIYKNNIHCFGEFSDFHGFVKVREQGLTDHTQVKETIKIDLIMILIQLQH